MTTLRVAYVLGTTAGGTGRHVAMLADGCLSAGIAVSVFGPEAARGLFPAGPEAARVPGGALAASFESSEYS